MQLKITTDYAIRIVLYLSIVKEASSQELSDSLKISKNYIRKLMSSSNLKKFVDSKPGVGGGLFLRKNPKDICLFDVIEAMEPDSLDKFLIGEIDEKIPISPSYLLCCKELQEQVRKVFSAITFEDLNKRCSDEEEWMCQLK